MLLGPVALKIGSTGYRFARYYTGSEPYVRKGPPPLALRLLAPGVVLTTLALFGTGVALLFAGRPAGTLGFAHKASFIAWFALMAIHVLGHLLELPRLALPDWRRKARPRRGSPAPGLRGSALAASILAGVAVALLARIGSKRPLRLGLAGVSPPRQPDRMDTGEKNAKREAGALRAQRRRAGELRGRVIALSLIAFVLLWGVVFAQMATGNDPVLGSSSASGSQRSRKATAATESTASAARAESGRSGRSEAAEAEYAEPEYAESESRSRRTAESEEASNRKPNDAEVEPEPEPLVTSQS